MALAGGLAYAARQRSRVALLLDHFKLTLDQYSRLTDRQIEELYFHARTQEGAIDDSLPIIPCNEPEEESPATLESELATVDLLTPLLRLDAAAVVELKTQLRAKYQKE